MQTTGTLQMVFACPSTCQNYQENGLRLPRSYRDHHKAPCHPDNISSFLRCIVSSDCKSKFDRSLFTPTNLEKHMREEHEGLEELCKPGKAVRLGGRLAVRGFSPAGIELLNCLDISQVKTLAAVWRVPKESPFCSAEGILYQ